MSRRHITTRDHTRRDRLLSIPINARRVLLPSAALATLGLTVVLAGGCSSSGSKAKARVDAPTLLQKAKAKVDSTQTLHFQLTSSNVSHDSTNITGGAGDMARPDSLQGTFSVVIRGFTANVEIVSKGGVFEAELPFASHYTKTNPSNFGLTDPAELMSPDKGLTSLLADAQTPQMGPSERLSGELLDTVTYTVPGTSIPVLPDLNPSKPVDMTVAIDPSTYELRTVTLVGPLTSATSNSTFILTLTKYGEPVTITLPPSG